MFTCLKLMLFFFTYTTVFGANIALAAESTKESTTQLFNLLSKLNRYSPIEHAGSHGSYGTNLGIGMSLIDGHLDNMQLRRYVFSEESENQANQIQLAKAYLLSGTMFPVDIGIEFGNSMSSDINQLGAHLQWTAFEGFHWPAVAIRASYSKLMGLRDTLYQSIGADALVSYGVVRYFTAYIGGGIQQNRGEITIEDKEQFGLSKTDENHYQKKNQSYSAIYGLMIDAPYYGLAAGFEILQFSDKDRSFGAKLNLRL